MNPDLLSPERIKLLAGASRFEQGMQAKGKVPIEKFVMNRQSASATITGFAVSLQSKGDRLEWACTCPESDGIEFCQHCVQLALHAGKSIQQRESLLKGPDKSKILAYLLSMDQQDLAKHMLALLEESPEQFKRYLLKASLETDEPDYPALKKELTQLTRVDQKLFSQRQFKHFFSRIERFLDEVSSANYHKRPESMLRLVEYGIVRLNALLDKMEDRGMQRQQAVAVLSNLYLTLFASMSGRDETLSKRFEKSWLHDRHQVLGLSVSEYFSAFPEAQKVFANRLLALWKSCHKQCSIPAGSNTVPESGLEIWQCKKIARYGIELAEKEVGWKLSLQQKQSMREALAETDQDYLQVSKYWLQEGHMEEATDVLERSLAAGNQHPEALRTLAKLYGTQDQDCARLSALFKRYCHELGIYAFECIGREDLRQRFATEAATWLENQTDRTLLPLLLRALLELDRAGEALLLAQKIDLDNEALQSIAERFRNEEPEGCCQLLQTHIERLLAKMMVSADKKAADLMVILETIQPAVEFEHYVEQLQPQIRNRPKFVESYEQSTTNRLT